MIEYFGTIEKSRIVDHKRKNIGDLSFILYMKF